MHAWKCVTRIPNNWISVRPKSVYINQRVGVFFLSIIHIVFPLCTTSIYSLVSSCYGWCGNKFPLCLAHAFYSSISIVFVFIWNRYERSGEAKSVSAPVNLETVSYSLFLCNCNGWRWIANGVKNKQKNQHNANILHSNDKLIVYCFWTEGSGCWAVTLDWQQSCYGMCAVCYSSLLLLFLLLLLLHRHLLFLHVSAGAPFLIKLLMPKHRSLLFPWFVAFVYSIFPRLRVYVYEMWSVEYNFTLNRLCTHASDYSLIWLNDS